MLHRSFKAAKCKTALKLAVSRIKLLKNKRDAQVKQMKRELAQLLESGQVQTARIRVEHVVREEKTMAAYDLIEIYCELIVARLPIIESQKNCPIDLKEAISGVIFASPRCSDVPELMDVRKHIAAKYGKEFVSAAVELRPDCGVNRMLVEKLSAKSPDGPTKVKILSSIAEEHNVKWDPATFAGSDIKSQEESHIRESTSGNYLMPPVQTEIEQNIFEDVNHVRHLVQTQTAQSVTPPVQTPPYHGDPGSPRSHNSSKHDASNQSKIVDEHTGRFSATEVRGSVEATSGKNSQAETWAQKGRMYHEDGNTSLGRQNRQNRQNRKLNFKDAASAAQAAAESAELASMAARAAAELSRQEEMTGQHAIGSSNSSAFIERDGLPQYTHHDSNHISNESDNGIFYSSSSQVPGVKIDDSRREDLVGPSENVQSRYGANDVGEFSHSASLNFGSAFDVENPFGHDVLPRTYTDNDALSYQINMQRQYSRSEVDFVTEFHQGTDPEKMATSSSLYSRSSSLKDNHNGALMLNRQKMDNNAASDLFVTHEVNSQGSFKDTNLNDDSFVKFDDSESDNDDYEIELNSHASPPGGGSSVNQLANTNSSIHAQRISKLVGNATSESSFSLEQQSKPVFTENLTKSSLFSSQDESIDVTFDDSDGLSTVSEEDLRNSKNENLSSITSATTLSIYHELPGSPSTKGKLDFNRKPWVTPCPDDLDNLAKHSSRNLRIDSSAVPGDEFGLESAPKRQPPSSDTTARQSSDALQDTRYSEKSESDNALELNYGTLTGGFRNKGYIRPPYIRNLLSESSPSPASVRIEEPSSGSPPVSSGARFHAPDTIETCMKDKDGGLRSHSTYSYSDSDSDSDSDEGDFSGFKSLPKASGHSQNLLSKKVETDVSVRSSSKTSNFFSGDDSASSTRTISSGQKTYSRKVGTGSSEVSSSRASMFGVEDTDDYLPKQTSEKHFHLVSGFSRRTRTPANIGQNRSRKGNDPPQASATCDDLFPSKSSSNDDYQQKLPPQMKIAGRLGSPEEHESGKRPNLRRIHEPTYSHEENASTSDVVKPSNSLNKRGQPHSAEPPKSRDTGEVTTSNEKASHVHPKLPDYDSLTAHFQSLRRQ